MNQTLVAFHRAPPIAMSMNSSAWARRSEGLRYERPLAVHAEVLWDDDEQNRAPADDVKGDDRGRESAAPGPFARGECSADTPDEARLGLGRNGHGGVLEFWWCFDVVVHPPWHSARRCKRNWNNSRSATAKVVRGRVRGNSRPATAYSHPHPHPHRRGPSMRSTRGTRLILPAHPSCRGIPRQSGW